MQCFIAAKISAKKHGYMNANKRPSSRGGLSYRARYALKGCTIGRYVLDVYMYYWKVCIRFDLI